MANSVGRIIGILLIFAIVFVVERVGNQLFS